MASKSVSVTNFPYWETSKRRIRYLYLVGDDSFQLTKPSTNEEPAIPLFLGADLFLNTDVRTENHPRYHAKFAKKGLATKLAFSSDFRFQGLRVPCSSNSLWFYCVHGVFRVAFELYSKHEQLSVLESFQDLWKSRINDDQLHFIYNIGIQLDEEPSNTSDQEEPMRLNNLSSDISVSTEDQLNCQDAMEDLEEVILDSTSGQAGNSSSADHDYCSLDEPVESKHHGVLTERLYSIANKVNCTSTVDRNQEVTMVKLLDYVEYWIDGQLDEAKLSEAVMVLLQTHRQGYSIYSSPLLQTVASWLGRRFHEANSTVSDQVEGFKMRNIEHIKDLPPAEDLANELFPEAMRDLLIHWMGLSEEAATWKRLSEYPIVLLILEFANHNLITGVAHVLYSSLICR
ncbi:uncharacterized protein si:ch211-110p13.9 [Clarias gariepinus]|uniref:uncharacterized protein si:ch211-110p13.9 n=1 Tax=Clarias gariepinus TaxID=13013 RepID=UPI00234DF58B|nr:uncharacterized protein si:ch211-110p13.9 [Clarias gariepinus]